jgi:hypothetical protein
MSDIAASNSVISASPFPEPDQACHGEALELWLMYPGYLFGMIKSIIVF